VLLLLPPRISPCPVPAACDSDLTRIAQQFFAAAPKFTARSTRADCFRQVICVQGLLGCLRPAINGARLFQPACSKMVRHSNECPGARTCSSTDQRACCAQAAFSVGAASRRRLLPQRERAGTRNIVQVSACRLAKTEVLRPAGQKILQPAVLRSWRRSSRPGP